MYYRIFESCDDKIVGRLPQAKEATVPTTVDDPNYIGSFRLKKAPEDVYLPTLILNYRSKLTDFPMCAYIDSSASRVASKKLKDCLASGNYSGTQFFDISIVDTQSEIHDYCIIHPYEYGFKHLDIQSSRFYIVKDVLHPEDLSLPLDFNTLEELLAYRANNPMELIMVEHIVMKKNTDVDFFTLGFVPNGGIGYFMSQKMKEKVEQAGCTGIVYKELNQPRW